MPLPRLRSVFRAYLLSMAFWCGISLLMGLQYRPPSREHFWSSLADFLIEAALRGFALAFWTPPIFYLVGKYLGDSSNRLRYALMWSLGAIPFLVLHSSILWVLVPPYDDTLQRYLPRSFSSWFEKIRYGFADQVFIYIAIVVAAHAYEYLKRLRREERERYEYQRALAASELQALKMQLHPHFLFNTLHGIATLTDENAKSAKAMILKLSSLLRTSLDGDGADLISLENELKFVREYLDLEKMRFGSRLRVEWSVAPETRQLLVPKMILQPLVENAIRHGIAASRGGGSVEVAACRNGGNLNIHVRNSAGGKASSGTGTGLRNVEARLKYLFSGDAQLHLDVAQDGAATVSLALPALNSEPAGLRMHSLQSA